MVFSLKVISEAAANSPDPDQQDEDLDNLAAAAPAQASANNEQAEGGQEQPSGGESNNPLEGLPAGWSVSQEEGFFQASAVFDQVEFKIRPAGEGWELFGSGEVRGHAQDPKELAERAQSFTASQQASENLALGGAEAASAAAPAVAAADAAAPTQTVSPASPVGSIGERPNLFGEDVLPPPEPATRVDEVTLRHPREGGPVGVRPEIGAGMTATVPPVYPRDIPPQMVAPGAPGGQMSAVGMSAGNALSNLIAAPVGLAVGMAQGLSSGLGARVMGWMARRQIAGQQLMEQAVQNRVEAAESAVVEAELASIKLVKMAEEFRTSSGFKPLYEEIEQEARKSGKLVGDIITEMRRDGSQPGLWDKFQGLLSTNPTAAEQHQALRAQAEQHETAWKQAAHAVKGVEGNFDGLWGRFDQATAKIRTSCQGIPVDEGKSFSDMARKILENMREVFCRVFRLVPKDEPGARPAARPTI